MIRNIRYRRDQRQLEEEEEMWFNEEDDFSDVPAAKPEIESYSMMKSESTFVDGIISGRLINEILFCFLRSWKEWSIEA